MSNFIIFYTDESGTDRQIEVDTLDERLIPKNACIASTKEYEKKMEAKLKTISQRWKRLDKEKE